eukprot:351548-Chlamydomonas_euryale.AAC.7
MRKIKSLVDPRVSMRRAPAPFSPAHRPDPPLAMKHEVYVNLSSLYIVFHALFEGSAQFYAVCEPVAMEYELPYMDGRASRARVA